jgi:hypothetical protein
MKMRRDLNGLFDAGWLRRLGGLVPHISGIHGGLCTAMSRFESYMDVSRIINMLSL